MSSASLALSLVVVDVEVFMDNVGNFSMYAEIGNKQPSKAQLKLRDSPNPHEFAATPEVGIAAFNVIAQNIVVLPQQFKLLNQQCDAFENVISLEQR